MMHNLIRVSFHIEVYTNNDCESKDCDNIHNKRS